MDSESNKPATLKSGADQKLSAEDKRLIYQDYHRSANKSEVARKWDINRSYMYEIVKECDALILSGFVHRHRGRKASNEAGTLPDANERIKILEAENRRLDEERERYYARSEFMKLRLKWAEREAAELRGEIEEEPHEESPTSEISKNRKRHLKKKRRKKR